MYLKYVNILYFIIFTYLCLRICALDIGMEQYRLFVYKGSNDCIITLPPIDNDMPMLYDPATNLTIYPNRQGHIIFKHNASVRMSCVGNHFVSPINDSDVTEITIKCINRHKLQYNGTDYPFDQFKCLNVPVSSIAVVNKTCQGVNSQVINVGFQTKNKHIILYRICFHTKLKTTLYSWYYVDVPKYRYIQNSTSKPNFMKTGTFGSLDVEAAYENQQDTMSQIVSSKKLARWYIQFEETKEFEGIRYLLKGHLLTNTDFVYAYEQHATYYNENTAPQWLIYSEGPRLSIEKYFKRFVLRQNTRHLIVSGTFLVSSPLNNKLKRCPVYLYLPKQMPVPEFFWKMDYDVKKKKGIVFLGFNGPFRAVETIKQACATTPCPNRYRRNYYTRDLFYCCTKEAFEDSFGKFSPVLFEEF